MLRLSLSVIAAITRLPRAQAKKVPKFLQMLDAKRRAPSLHVERLFGSALYSARLDQAYRGILEERDGHVTLVCLDKHDAAYRWAERHAGAVLESAAFPLDTSVDEAPPARRVGTAEASDASPAAVATFDVEDPVGGLKTGYIVTWDELGRRFRWDTDGRGYYLREKDGRVVCACLQAELNPNAPWEILVGSRPENIRQAEVPATQTSPIPVFVKAAVNQWEYWGMFRFDRYGTDEDEFRKDLPLNRLRDTSGVLYLASADDE